MNYKENLIKEIEADKSNYYDSDDLYFKKSIAQSELKGYETAQKEFSEWLKDLDTDDYYETIDKIVNKIKELKGEK